ncbi:MAG TPA: hypothetical protein DCM14_01630 [Clostridiales bacterium UBA8153]|nr:hypothetical protein [Clostridiales bacterium UBA8153]
MTKDPLTPERRDEICQAIAERVAHFGMITPAIIFLEMHRPISFLGSQAMHFFSPIVGVFFSSFEEYAFFFEDRGNIDRLVQKLEELARKQDEEERALRERNKADRQKRKAAKR